MLFGLRSFHLIRGELQPAFELAQQLVSLAESVQDSGLLVEAHLAQGNSLFLFGKLIPALEHFERAISLYDPQTHHVHAFLYGLDPGVFCLVRTAWLLELLGHSDQASKRMGEAVALAHRQSHAFSLAVALMHVIIVLTFAGNGQRYSNKRRRRSRSARSKDLGAFWRRQLCIEDTHLPSRDKQKKELH